MDLAARLNSFDGKHVAELEEVARQLPPEPAVIELLCSLSRESSSRLQTAATWILKRFHDDGFAYSTAQAGRLADLLQDCSHWEARLHLLQILPSWRLSKARGKRLIPLLTSLLDDSNKFIRAWSYHAVACLADRDPTGRELACRLIEQGQRDAAASVRARIRNTVKQYPWLRDA